MIILLRVGELRLIIEYFYLMVSFIYFIEIYLPSNTYVIDFFGLFHCYKSSSLEGGGCASILLNGVFIAGDVQEILTN